jgi:hypothetical protein
MAKSDYKYSIRNAGTKTPVIEIIDQNYGNMSVTNDIENVVKEIEGRENLDACKCIIIYRDSTYTWDGWDAVRKEFVSLNESTPTLALLKMIQDFQKKNNCLTIFFGKDQEPFVDVVIDEMKKDKKIVFIEKTDVEENIKYEIVFVDLYSVYLFGTKQATSFKFTM